MDNKVGYTIIVLLVAVLAVVVVGFVFLQGEINKLNPQKDTPTPEPTYFNTPTQSPQSTANPTSTYTPLSHTNVVYEWYLKPEYINNVTWLSQRKLEVGPAYDDSLTWKQNYYNYLSQPIAYPEQAKDDPLVWGLLGRNVFVSADFNEATGYTKVVYEYTEYQGATMLYGIEAYLPEMTVNGHWTRTYT